jgi:hypothetical protein
MARDNKVMVDDDGGDNEVMIGQGDLMTGKARQ